ncbi:hypothetical protein DFR24_3732 [Panacagrimonas perspica]|uniref:DUF4440 domain-containing protein n=1 Tax=Panacagrimonas perspica TaxID=381431 RepID=A0A4R7P0D2_9GAMM|nr:hypothetical protein [Panacagrimonas perspica]TDU26702.1 hypothetical protein DFR24_3732 [Panacagrimonas perspica]THD04049.1 hypothetical protein B1810_07275 [Panacagrimonas perspica]
MTADRTAFAGVWLLLAVAVLTPLDAQAQAKRLVCWTDDMGRKACGDSLPPKYADKPRNIIDPSGRTVKVVPGAPTPEQRVAMEAKARQDAVAQRAAEQQSAYDRALLATYATPQELASLRDDRLASIDTSIELSEASVRRDMVSVAELRARLPAATSKEKPEPRLLKQVTEFEESLADTQHSLAALRKNRETLCNNFTRDIRRFQELKNGAVTFTSPCPVAGSLSSDAAAATDITGVRAFFDHHAELENDFDPAFLDNYAENAVIRIPRLDASGKPVIEERKIADYRAELIKALPAAKQKLETHQYSDIRIEPGKDGRATVSGKRTSTLSKTSEPFYVVVRSSGSGWKIVEAGSQPAP